MGTRKGLRRKYSASSRGVFMNKKYGSIFTVTPFGRLIIVQGAVPGRFQSEKSDLLLVETAEEKTGGEFRLL